jgi:DNA invertase Pin-like site-specific DNA recombinase
MNQKVKAVGYVRIAITEQEVGNNSLSKQKERILEAAAQSDIEIVRWYEYAGSDPDLALGAIQAYCEKDVEVKYLFVSDIGRLSRSRQPLIDWQDFLGQLGVTIVTAESGGNIKSSDYLLEPLLAATAQHEHEIRSDAIKEGLRRNKLAEKPTGE